MPIWFSFSLSLRIPPTSNLWKKQSIYIYIICYFTFFDACKSYRVNLELCCPPRSLQDLIVGNSIQSPACSLRSQGTALGFQRSWTLSLCRERNQGNSIDCNSCDAHFLLKFLTMVGKDTNILQN